MVSKQSRSEIRRKKHYRLRNRFAGTTERPRLAVFRSNNHMYAQIIDDTVGNTLVSASGAGGNEKQPLADFFVRWRLLSVSYCICVMLHRLE